MSFTFKSRSGMCRKGAPDISDSWAPKEGASPGASAPPVVLPDLAPSFKRALKFVAAAQANLLAASTVMYDQVDSGGGGIQVFSREFRMRQLNRHFAFDKFPDKRYIYNIIYTVFRRMQQLFERPGGVWGPHVFEPDTLNNQKDYAYTNFGGFFRGGQFKWAKGGRRIRLDSIYICAGFHELTGRVDEQALVHVHEMAHFVGHPQYIDDHAYNTQPEKLKRLSPQLRVLNAESYSNFAWEAAHPGVAPPL